MSENIFESIESEYMGSRKKNALRMIYQSLKNYRDETEDSKKNIISDAATFYRLAFLNPQLLTAALVMYNKGIDERRIYEEPSLLDRYIDNYILVKRNKDGYKNDLLRYILIVDDHYSNMRERSFNIIRQQTERALEEEEEEIEWEDY